MANSIAVNTQVVNSNSQFQGLFSQVWTVKATITQDTAVAINDTGAITFTVTGVALGDMVIAGGINVDWSDGTDQAVISFEVTAANTVTMYIHADVGEFASTAVHGAIAKVLIGRPAW